MGSDAFWSFIVFVALASWCVRDFFGKVDPKGEVKQAAKEKLVSTILKRLK
jgi:hypothetical protein